MKKKISFILIVLFLFMYPPMVNGETAEYETEVEVGFFGKYQESLKPGANVPDRPSKPSVKDKVLELPTKELSNVQRLPQTNELEGNILIFVGIGLLVILLVSLYYKKSEEIKR